MGIISGFSTVILPRFSSLVSENRMEEYRRLFSRSLQTTFAFACYVAFGIAAVAREFVPFFFGPGYSPCVSLTQVLSSVILIKTISFTIRYQYLIPCKKEKYYISSVMVGAGGQSAADPQNRRDGRSHRHIGRRACRLPDSDPMCSGGIFRCQGPFQVPAVYGDRRGDLRRCAGNRDAFGQSAGYRRAAGRDRPWRSCRLRTDSRLLEADRKSSG